MERHNIARGGRAAPGSRRRRPGVRAGTLFAVLGPALLLSMAARGEPQQTEEYRVKAAFLYHFTQMVDWPGEAPGDEKRAIAICTIGKDPFGGNLEASLEGKLIGARPLEIRHLTQPGEAQGCQVVFVPDDRKQVAQTLAALKNAAVLTVGDGEDFAKQGGMIGFSMDSDDKVRFVINVDAASRARLKISSRLLVLAKTVIGSHP
jgi:uncharacterized protein DUF4154